MSRMHNPPHPGEALRDGWPQGLSITEAARQLGVSRVALSRVLNGRAAVSADMAVRLGLWLGTGPEIWINMQAGYDLWQAERKPRPKVAPLERAA